MRQPIWQQPKIPTPCNGDPEPENSRRCQRPFHNGSSIRREQSMRNSRGISNAIAIVAHRKNTRIVGESEFLQDVQCPKGFTYDGIARRAISEYRGAGNVLEKILGAERFFAKFLGRLLVHEAVGKAVACDLVAVSRNISDQLWIPLGHPSQYKESPPDIKLIEDREELFSVPDHTGFA